MGHQISEDLTIVIAKLDSLSQRTSVIAGDELMNAPDKVVQNLLTQLASIVVDNCAKIPILSMYNASNFYTR